MLGHVAQVVEQHRSGRRGPARRRSARLSSHNASARAFSAGLAAAGMRCFIVAVDQDDTETVDLLVGEVIPAGAG